MHPESCIPKLLETVADAALRRTRAVQARHEPRAAALSARWTQAGWSQRDNPLPTTSGCARGGLLVNNELVFVDKL